MVAFGLFGDQGVFQREASAAASIVASRFGNGGPVIVHANTKTGGEATIAGLDASLRAAAATMSGDVDILVLILTSHGSREGLAVKAGRREEVLSPHDLAPMLERTGIKRKVVIISACYSGVFVGALANPDTLVITAADADHPSFGCEDEAKWTYFGDAFFNVALRTAKTFEDAFARARILVRIRELSHGFDPSNPQIGGGANLRPLLVARR
ncbi:MAG: peptidase C13, legumain asparaginyl peptidase [Methylobacteriaceae bacterium]|nr:peptidase C13, legumain asparaginyl peptidase [Methylobacteriaceae bacterium]